MDFDRMPKFKSLAFEIVTRIGDWAWCYEVDCKDIERQVAIAHMWIVNNPKRAPRKDIMRFLNNWMSIASRIGSLSRKTATFKESLPDPQDVMSGNDFARMRERLAKS